MPVALAAGVLLAAREGHATWSIAATDRATMQVGGAGATCLDRSVHVIYGSAPGHGVIHAQAALGSRGRERAVPLLARDEDPREILRVITDPAFDAQYASRQYGVVDLMGRAAGFTGANALAYKEDRQGAVGTYVYSVQGNILTSARVLDQAQAAFEAPGCDLAERLMASLEAGGLNGEGDRRCTPARPASVAFIEVDRAGEPAGSYLLLDVTGVAGDPLPELRRRFAQWRASHPCAAVDAGAAEDAASDAGAGEEGGRDAGLDVTGRDDASATPRGCACHSAIGAKGAAWWRAMAAVGASAALRRRARRRMA